MAIGYGAREKISDGRENEWSLQLAVYISQFMQQIVAEYDVLHMQKLYLHLHIFTSIKMSWACFHKAIINCQLVLISISQFKKLVLGKYDIYFI